MSVSSVEYTKAVSAYRRTLQLNHEYDSAEDRALPQAAAAAPTPFRDLLVSSLGETADMLNRAQAVSEAATTGDADVTDLAAALTEAEQQLKMIVTVRDRLVSAIQEVFRMPV